MYTSVRIELASVFENLSSRAGWLASRRIESVESVAAIRRLFKLTAALASGRTAATGRDW